MATPKKISFFGAGSNVVQVVCGSGWSTAVTATGSLYMWGQGDGGWLGMPPPNDLVVLNEGDPPINPISSSSSLGKGSRDIAQQKGEQQHLTHSCSFDSQHNILVPVRINQYLRSPQYAVERVRCGGSHTVLFLAQRREEDRQTDDEEEFSRSPLNRALSSSNSDRGGGKEGGGLVASLLGSKRSPPRHSKEFKGSEPSSPDLQAASKS